MKKEKVDRRIKYTKMVIQESLLQLIKEKPIAKISIKELCEKADVNRGTFYNHYQDVYDVLDNIQSKVSKEIIESVTVYLQSTKKQITDFSLYLFEYLDKNREIFKILLSKNANGDFIDNIYFLVQDTVMKDWKQKNPKIDDKTLKMMFHYIAYGSISILQLWIENDLQTTPEEMSIFMNQISEFGYSKYLIVN
ncbi:AcrR family transcriptional regulator [Breznakia sp. PF5-3]|uniref:TetR/AcrR family transcriptional regulator n=1 Tax=unclassified Breznakia TaxID=2623764 RepID=UPI002405F754|nr:MULTISPECIES: TetR/AcrR family transcriptional regulator [unclassified Breznakia]MDL2276691.1 TetR/AcrR family transcriptional regulator [Breznakia sp. OttesenSCG-928-G09]MDF9824035.1 AcrR family transcriptional regulator [Breznakia sp. PM6-1]MDF9834899.1 AcrR family transcriptional regulator [Breznakia sp. PF5-3]MDF9837079.1 AcrR family transcriptional regulator [Breznakia sp. PFB2-8]MDF9859004.1 AcrR family transcriptional regulator [Breznakia sp. PH5-24]